MDMAYDEECFAALSLMNSASVEGFFSAGKYRSLLLPVGWEDDIRARFASLPQPTSLTGLTLGEVGYEWYIDEHVASPGIPARTVLVVNHYDGKTGTEELFARIMATFVDDGSYMNWQNEYGESYRWDVQDDPYHGRQFRVYSGTLEWNMETATPITIAKGDVHNLIAK